MLQRNMKWSTFKIVSSVFAVRVENSFVLQYKNNKTLLIDQISTSSCGWCVSEGLRIGAHTSRKASTTRLTGSSELTRRDHRLLYWQNVVHLCGRKIIVLCTLKWIYYYSLSFVSQYLKMLMAKLSLNLCQ